MAYNPKDHYFRKAKEQNYAARSVFKLEEIDSRLRLFKPGQTVLDLGAAPGSWSQYASKKVGRNGRVFGIDLSPVTVKIPNGAFLQADLRDVRLPEVLAQQGICEPVDLVLSDMAPKTTGIKMTDQARSLELCELALAVARQWLRKDGAFVCKLFHSDDFTKLRDEMKKDFQRFEAIRPDSTRRISKEIFLVGLGKKEPPRREP